MKAVWSFWTKPFEAHRHSMWPSAKHHLLAWALSVETARRHYTDSVSIRTRNTLNNLANTITYSSMITAVTSAEKSWAFSGRRAIGNGRALLVASVGRTRWIVARRRWRLRLTAGLRDA